MNLSWKQAWLESPGPRTRIEYVSLFLKAMLMGIADLIPGVSGGTIAFITGIYESLLNAISSLKTNLIKDVLKFDFKTVIASVHIRFISTLLLGVLTSIFVFARLMHYLITEQAIYTWSFFFGLILASVFMLATEVKNFFAGKNLLSFILGAAFAYFFVALIPVQTPNALWFIFICGFVGITAMILPGISGSFLLLILGKYEYITAAIKNPFAGKNIVTIIVFALGALASLLSVSKLLSYFYNRYPNLTVSFLTGVLLGSLRKVWPWKQTLETTVIRGKTYILKEANIIPSMDYHFVICLICALVAIGLLSFFHYFQIQKNKKTL